MKKIYYFFILVLFVQSLAGQVSLNPGIGMAYLQQPQMAGLHFSNNLIFAQKHNQIEIGFDFIIAKGNKDIDFYKHKALTLNYNYYAPPFPNIVGTPTFDKSDKIIFLNHPYTASSENLILKIGYRYNLLFRNQKLLLIGGFYGSYVNTSYSLGPYSDSYIVFDNRDTVNNLDFVFPVNLSYINIGLYGGISYTFLPEKKYPLIMKLQYYYGRYHSGLWSLGLSVPLKFSGDAFENNNTSL